jgi:hypothetical protein
VAISVREHNIYKIVSRLLLTMRRCMKTTGEDVLEDILLEHLKGDRHTVKKTVGPTFYAATLAARSGRSIC